MISDFSQSENDDIKLIGDNLAKYLHDDSIDNIIFLDRSARPGYLALRKSWEKLYPQIRKPNIYFTNPDGYNMDRREMYEIIQEFDTTYSKLATNKSAKILLFDVCMHTGENIKPIIKTMKKAGYKHVLVGLTQPKETGGFYISRPNVDFEALYYEPEGECYPFQRDKMIEKNSVSVISSKQTEEMYKTDSLELRREILKIYEKLR